MIVRPTPSPIQVDALRSSPVRNGMDLLRHAFSAFSGQIVVTSSFGTTSAVLLALVAEIDRAVPVLFLDTGKHFAETLVYRNRLVDTLGLLDVRDLGPAPAALATVDPAGELWRTDADACCALRKVAPLRQALAPFAAWVTGRRKTQSDSRRALPFLERDDGRVKINPLADWSAERVEAEMVRRNLPRHPLARRGYMSVGCAPCTHAVAAGGDPRSGRWAGSSKTECGIHYASGLPHQDATG